MIFPPEETSTPLQPETPSPASGGPPRSVLRSMVAAGVLTLVLAAFGGAALSHVLWPPSNGAANASANTNGGSNVFGGGFQPQNGNGGSNLFGNGEGNNGGSGTNSQGGTPALSASAAAVAHKVDPGLVDINTQTADGAAAGTGMVVTADGEVITNNHVISGAESISVYDIGNGHTYSARVIGYDRKHDVAVLMLNDASGLTTIPLGDSSTVKVGADVLTFGNAGGVGGTPSIEGGSVDALKQAITASDPSVLGDSEQLQGLIQINGDIQPGDSGGPLTTGGKVVGMDTAASVGFTFQSSSSGAGYAIPINQVLSISRAILDGDASTAIHIGKTAIIGVYVSDNTPEDDIYNQCSTSDADITGTLVAGLTPSSPAASTGLQQCDLITTLDGQSVTNPTTLLNVMETHHPGDRVTLGWKDTSGGSHSATVTLGSGAPN